MSGGRAPWWKGTRGEWYVIGQFALMALVFLGPRRAEGWPDPRFPGSQAVGLGLIAVGGALFIAGGLALRRNLTPLPHPVEGARLVTSGPYRLARHPIYGGGILLALGWALWVGGGLTLVWVAALSAWLDLKSRREERWLERKFPEYPEYRKRVRRFIPFVY